MTVVLLLLLLFAVESIATWIILKRLEDRHPALCAELGMPSVGDMKWIQRWSVAGRFIYGGACFRLNDVPLNILCASVVLGEIAVLYAIFFSDLPSW